MTTTPNGDYRDIAVIGAGYVGLVNTACLAEVGHTVTCFDVDAAKVGRLNAGVVDIMERELPELLAAGLDTGRIAFHADARPALSDAEIVFLCVDTPTDPDAGPDLTNLMAAVSSTAEHAQRASTLVLRSTVPPGTSRIVEDELARLNGAHRITVVSHPEFFQEGSAVDDCRHPIRIVVGANDESAALGVAALWRNPGAPVIVTGLETAEMVKQASNAFLAAKISFINDIARICDAVGADVDTVANGMGLDPRIGPSYLRAGIGFGGSCLPKDLRALVASARTRGWDPQTLAAALEVNDSQRRWVSEKVAAHLGSVAGKKIAVLGIAFKPETADLRDSPAVAIAELLAADGANVLATDPAIQGGESGVPRGARIVADPYDAATGADAIVLATEWRQFVDLDWRRIAEAMSGNLVIDGRNALDPQAVRAAGLQYAGVGRGATRS